MDHALIDNQPRPGRIHGSAQHRLLARHPILEVLERVHVAGQRNLGQTGRRHIAKLAKEYQANHTTSRRDNPRRIKNHKPINHKPEGLAKKARMPLYWAMALTILLIDTDAERARALEDRLSESGYARVLRAEGPDLAAQVERAKPDLVIIDMALPDRDALEDIRSVSAASPVVMFAGTDDPAFAQEAIAAGVCSYNMSGVALQDVRPILASAIALFQRYRHVETELAAAKALLNERRLIERAKAILMKDRKMTEPDAYRWLQKKAMNESRKLAQVVADFVAEAENPQREIKP